MEASEEISSVTSQVTPAPKEETRKTPLLFRVSSRAQRGLRCLYYFGRAVVSDGGTTAVLCALVTCDGKKMRRRHLHRWPNVWGGEESLGCWTGTGPRRHAGLMTTPTMKKDLRFVRQLVSGRSKVGVCRSRCSGLGDRQFLRLRMRLALRCVALRSVA